ncbi:MAG: NAD(P)H-hydrate epimerase [Candidatus Hydrogenedens sp.]|nr:NAD(P)H-hydrate epimerase [Candidatus Hydrogenedens sp.]
MPALRPMRDNDRFLTAAQLREADRLCIEAIGIPGAVLMDHAGKAMYEATGGASPLGVVCGKGNNGGDGYVAARYALLDGVDTRVVSMVPLDSLTGDARLYCDVFQRLGGEVIVADTPEALDAALASLDDCAVIIDALLGTGISGEVRGLYRHAIEHWPSRPRTIAADLPSGLDADTGEPCGCAVKAAVTVTMAFPKAGFQNPAAREYTGEVLIADIGIPESCAE